jgi:N-acyl-D-aspartate/D-glutamate deacylase
MPAGGRRFIQRVDGYEAMLVAGTAIFERGAHAGHCQAGCCTPAATPKPCRQH